MKSFVGVTILIFILNNLNTFADGIDTSKWSLSEIKHGRSIDAAVTQYYESKTFMMSIGVHMEYSDQSYVMDFLSDALKNLKLMKYEIFVDTSYQLERVFVTKVSNYHLWYVDSYKAFRSLLTASRNVYSEEVSEYVIIMNEAKTLNQTREMQLILENSFKFNIFNIVIAINARNGNFLLYSYDIFKPHHCFEARVEQVNVFRNGYFLNEELFPYKFNNFNNCPITMYIRKSSLFFRYNLTKDGSQIASIEGVEAKMIQTMAEKLNFKLHMYYNEEDNSVGSVYENGTFVGPFRYLHENEVDVILGYYHYPVRSHYFGRSTTYTFMPLVIVISEYKRNDLFEIWLFRPFSTRTWLAIGLLSFAVVVLVQVAYYCLSKTATWIDIVGLVLGNSRPMYMKSFVTKVAFWLCILGIMILSATFQGRLYYAFNTEDVFKISTIQQLIKANYTFLITRRFNTDIIRSLHIPMTQIDFVDDPEDYLIYEKMRSYPSNSATFTNFWDFQMYIESKKYYNEFDMLSIVIILNQICAYLKKHSFLIEPINRIINALTCAGIFNKWLHDMADVGKNSPSHFGTKHIRKLSNKPLPLTLHKFQIVFAGLIFLYLLSILIFLGEIIVRDWQKIVKKFQKVKSSIVTFYK